jgi:general secretion pathway protein A
MRPFSEPDVKAARAGGSMKNRIPRRQGADALGDGMYPKHFGLTHRLFRPAPDGTLPGLVTSREPLADRVTATLRDGDGIALVTGAAGVGKTFLARTVAERLEGPFTTVWVGNSHLRDSAALLQAVLFDLDLPYQGRSEQELRLAVTESLMTASQTGRPLLVIIDDAHHLAAVLLEELRLLGNLETPDGKMLHVLLSGLPDLTAVLRQPALVSLAQQVGAVVGLEPLNPDEALAFLETEVTRAGGRVERLLSDEAAEVLIEHARGLPRLLARLTDRAFRLSAQAGQRCVDAEAVLAAVDDLRLIVPEADADDAPLLRAALPVTRKECA